MITLEEYEQARRIVAEFEKQSNKVALCDVRELEFKQHLNKFHGVYPNALIIQFYEYWSERNKSQSKMRYELEPTFDLSLRLKTWSNNANRKFSNATLRNNQTSIGETINAIRAQL